MKKFFQVVMAIKEGAAMSYTASMCFYMFFLFVFKQEAASLSMLFSLLLVCVAAGTLQVAVFTDLFIKKLAYGWRLVVFVVPFFAVIAAFAVAFQWFPTENVQAWLSFGVIFIIIFLVFTAGIEVYYRMSGKKYDRLLGLYHRREEEK